MQPEIKTLEEKKCVGLSIQMSVVQNKTSELWSTFMPKINTIKHKVCNDKISLQMYPKDYFRNFNPNTNFEKWALVEVSDLSNFPKGMAPFILKKGLYAVFKYKSSSADTSIFQYIYSEWLPKSIYQIDDRPHFEVLGDNYKNNNPESEEDIWIPIKKK